MSDNHRQRLEAALARRDAAQQKVQMLQGKLAAATDIVTATETECKERGIPPAKLDQAILQLEKRYAKALADFEQDMIIVEGKLDAFI